MPELRRLLIGDRPAAWTEAGFAVDGDRNTLGTVEIRFVDDAGPGLRGWELAGLDDGVRLPDQLDGIPTAHSTDPAPEPMSHPNGVTRLDHVVIMTPDLPRTIARLRTFGFEPRRTRDVPGAEPARRQVFLWAGEPILEVVGPVEPSGDGPASLWGLALTSDDLDGAAELLGPRISTPKDAVQPGRRIATIDSRALGIGVGLALMTPHVR